MSKKSKHAVKDRHALATAPSVPPGEWKRKLVHIGVGGFALALRFLTPFQAVLLALSAFVFNFA